MGRMCLQCSDSHDSIVDVSLSSRRMSQSLFGILFHLILPVPANAFLSSHCMLLFLCCSLHNCPLTGCPFRSQSASQWMFCFSRCRSVQSAWSIFVLPHAVPHSDSQSQPISTSLHAPNLKQGMVCKR